MFVDLVHAIQNLRNKYSPQDTQALLKQIQFGCSLSPEELQNKGIALTPHETLNILTRNYNIEVIRFGLRWDNCTNLHGETTLEYYQEWLDVLVENNIEIILNIGVKVFRWPEVHLPGYLIRRFGESNLKQKTTIFANDEVATKAFEHYSKLCQLLSDRYGSSAFQTIQIENEHTNSFGEYKWVFSDDYIQKAVEIVNGFFAECDILLNSPGENGQLQHINDLLLKLRTIYPDKVLLNGINHYYDRPWKISWPTFGKFDTLADIEKKDRFLLPRIIKTCEENNIKMVCTELQWEPWEKSAQREGSHSAGNNLDKYQLALARVTKNYFPIDNSNKKLILLWGIEYQLRKLLQANNGTN